MRAKIEDIVAYNHLTGQFATVVRIVEDGDEKYIKTQGAGMWPAKEVYILSSQQLKRLTTALQSSSGPYENLTNISWLHPTKEDVRSVLYCCDMIRINSELKCMIHKNTFDCPDTLVHHSWDGDFGIIIHDGGGSYTVINYCPWCGTKL